MAFHLASNWKDRGPQIQAVKDKCNHILDELALPADDARAQGIIHVRQFCNTLAAVPIKLSQNAGNKSDIPVIMRLLGLENPKHLKSCLGDLNKNAKVSFVTMVQFALENCVERILDGLPGEKPLGSFSKSSLRLIEVTDLADGKAKHEVLSVPAWIRNTLHGAGIHSHASKTVTIDGEAYVFEKGKRFSSATWSHLTHTIRCALDVYEEMLCSPVVVSVSKIAIAPGAGTVSD